MTYKTALVTGATGTIGKAIARRLATKKFRVILVARNKEKAETALREIRDQTKAEVDCLLGDLSRKRDIKKIAEEWNDPVHILINNAGATPVERMETAEGIELQWATNVLGYFWTTRYFTPHLEESGEARVINVASYWAGGLNLSDPEFKQRPYDNDAAYRQSKQADRMLAYAFSERLKAKNITVNACHPGDVRSKLSGDLGFGGSQTPDEAADTPVWLATETEGGEYTGAYFAHRKKATCPYQSDKTGIEKLFELCDSY